MLAIVMANVFTNLALGATFCTLLAGATIYAYSEGLPNHEQLRDYRPPTISQVYSQDGKLIDEFVRERRMFVPISEIPDIVKSAFISAEDKNFYSHPGFDMAGMVRAVAAAATKGEKLRGASTITQQVMKVFLLSSDRSVDRKIKEIVLARLLELTLDKEQILELYLNQIFLGQNSFGVVTAAQTYFNKTLDQLTIDEAAYLAALPKAPSTYHPVEHRERAIGRRNFVLREMAENGYISFQDMRKAQGAELVTVQGGHIESHKEQLLPRGYFTTEIRRQLSEMERVGEDQLFEGGLQIRATIDSGLQRAAGAALRKALVRYDRKSGVWQGAPAKISEADLETEAGWRAALAKTEVPRDVEGLRPAVALHVGKAGVVVGIEGEEFPQEGFLVPAKDLAWARRIETGSDETRRVRSLQDLLSRGDVIMVSKAFKEGEDGAPGEFTHWSVTQLPKIQGAFMAMDINTGHVLAVQGGYSFQQSVFNRATQATRQPGSAFKPIVYAAALYPKLNDNEKLRELAEGVESRVREPRGCIESELLKVSRRLLSRPRVRFTPATIVFDAPIKFETPEGDWEPKNYSGEWYGSTTLRTGIERSQNLMTIRLAQTVGIDVISILAECMGLYDDMVKNLSTALGSQETTLMQMLAAYAVFANGGTLVNPTVVDCVDSRRNRNRYVYGSDPLFECDGDSESVFNPELDSSRKRVLDDVTAYQITSMLQGVVERGTARGKVTLPVPNAGKTGTTNESRDIWYIGYTSNLVAGCYIGFDTPKPLENETGSTLCAPVFNEFMQLAVESRGGEEFIIPEKGEFKKVNRKTGNCLEDLAEGPDVIEEFFHEENADCPAVVIGNEIAVGTSIPQYTEEERILKEIEDQRESGIVARRPEPQGQAPGAVETAGAQGEAAEAKEAKAARPTFDSLSSGGTY